MRGFGFVLKAVLAVSMMLAGFAIVAALDQLAEQNASMPMKPELALDTATAEASVEPAPGVAAPEPAVGSRPRRHRSRHRQKQAWPRRQ